MANKISRQISAPTNTSTDKPVRGLRKFIQLLGPGFITGAADDDPSGIGTYSQAGAQMGFPILWTALFTYPLMATVQYICAKIGLVTEQGLAGVLRQHYPRWILYGAVLLLAVANIINIGADLGAIAAAIHLLIPAIPSLAMVFPISVLLLLVLIFGSYSKISNVLKWLAISLLAYIGAALLTSPDWHAVLQYTLVPSISFDKNFLELFVAIIGTTISPYLFFWQTSTEAEEKKQGNYRLSRRLGPRNKELKNAAADVNIGMFFSALVMYFIIFATAGTLHAHGIHQVSTVTQAASALRPIAGSAAEFLFACGIIGTGLLAVPVLAGSCAYSITEAFGWSRGFDEKWYMAKEFYFVIAVSTGLGMELDFFNINPMQALYWTAVINGLLAPPCLVLIMMISNNRKIMGKHTNSKMLTVIGWLTTVLMTLAAAALIWSAASSS